jgi:succinate dehydrogenase / fumarate reductase cytochrome b subunit
MSSAAARKPRPKYLNLSALLFEIRLPLPGWVSILHRISGAVLFFPGVLVLLWLLDQSLASPQGFEWVRNLASLWPVKLALLGFLWLFSHHFFAGIRYLFLDLDKGVDKETARMTSWVVFALGAATTLWLGAKLW